MSHRVKQNGELPKDSRRQQQRQQQQQQPHQASTKVSKELKDLGTKARARLEEEKMKRPEIQLLESIPIMGMMTNPKMVVVGTTTKKKKHHGTNLLHSIPPRLTTTTRNKNNNNNNMSPAPSSSSSPQRPPNRKRKMETSSSSQSRTARKKQRNIDTTNGSSSLLIPDISHIPFPDQEEISSSIRLHGLPIHCTIEHVKKFFSGLLPDRISILLPNHTHLDILDGMIPSSSSYTGGLVDQQQQQQQHSILLESQKVRIIADFHSPTAAILASERSGETIRIPTTNNNNNNDDDDGHDEQTFVIQVTVLDKTIASALESLKVPAVPRVTFDSTLKEIVTRKLHPMVPVILWSMAASRMLSESILPLDRNIRSGNVILNKEEEEKLLWDRSTTISWKKDPVYRRCLDHYNSLVDIQDDLLHHPPFPMVEISSRGCSLEEDPVLYLTTSACQALTQEMDRIEALLYRVRIFRRLKEHKVT